MKNKEDGRQSKLDVEAMQRDRDAGMSCVQLAAKYKCHVASVYAHTKASGKDRRHANPGRPSKGAPAEIREMIEKLRARRDALADESDALDRAIAALEKI